MRGSIKKREGKQGVSYQVRVEYPPDPVTGKRIQRSETYPTEKQAQARLAEWLVDLHKGTAVDPAKLTVAEYLDHWLAVYAKPNVRISTYARYAGYVRNHLTPRLGRHRLTRLTRAHIQGALAALAVDGSRHPRVRPGTTAGLAPGTIRGVHRMLHEALRHAVEWGYLATNPAAAVRPGRVPRAEIQVWDTTQLRHFLDTTGLTARYGALWLIAIATGMRQGELLGLGWRQVDFERGRLHVTRTLAQITNGQPVFTEPKTDRGRRVVPIDAHCVAALRDHQRMQDAKRQRLGDAWREHGLVFTEARGGPLRGSDITKRFQRLARKADLPVIRFHDLRHSHATMLLRDGVPVKVVSERLGHESIAVTLDLYSSVLPDMQQAAVDAITSSLFTPVVNKSVNTTSDAGN